MNDLQEQFLEETIAQRGKNYQNIFTFIQRIDLPDNVCDWDSMQFEEALIASKPNSLQEVSSLMFATEEFLKWLLRNGYSENYRCINEIGRINRQAVFYASLETNGIKKKYISYDEYNMLMQKIGESEINDVYYKALLTAIYEGIYSDDMSVLMNLKDTDIDGNVIKLHDDDGNDWDIEVSQQCAELLIMNARIQDFYIVAPHGGYRTEKKYCGRDGSLNACFKTALRNESADRKKSCRQSYCRILRCLDEYLGRHTKPKNIFISGIMHRASLRMEKLGMNLEDAFVFGNDNKSAMAIVQKELAASRYQIDNKGLKENIKGHLDEFK